MAQKISSIVLFQWIGNYALHSWFPIYTRYSLKSKKRHMLHILARSESAQEPVSVEDYKGPSIFSPFA